MKSNSLNIITILAAVLLAASLYLLTQVHAISKEKQIISEEIAEIHSVKHGMLNMNRWKSEISDIIATKVQEFEFAGDNNEALRGYVQKALHKLVDEVKIYLDQQKDSGNAFEKMIKKVAYDVAFDVEDFRKNIPRWTDEIMAELKNVDTQKGIKEYIQQKLDELMASSGAQVDAATLNYIGEKYGCEDMALCSEQLTGKRKGLDKQIVQYGLGMILAAVLILLLYFLFRSYAQNALYYTILVLAAIVLLIGGITTPMIDIDARVLELAFSIMGEEIAFKNQVLFFQSKSIFDVVKILIEFGGLQAMFVGVLILAFSILFPLCKILASMFAVWNPAKLRENSFLNWLALKSGKWSMADVFVVAIFMAYIGFDSILSNQLAQIAGVEKAKNIVSTQDHTSLQMGFYLFTAYCLFSLFLSMVTERFIRVEEEA